MGKCGAGSHQGARCWSRDCCELHISIYHHIFSEHWGRVIPLWKMQDSWRGSGPLTHKTSTNIMLHVFKENIVNHVYSAGATGAFLPSLLWAHVLLWTHRRVRSQRLDSSSSTIYSLCTNGSAALSWIYFYLMTCPVFLWPRSLIYTAAKKNQNTREEVHCGGTNVSDVSTQTGPEDSAGTPDLSGELLLYSRTVEQ